MADQIISAAQIKSWIAEALRSVPDVRIADHIRAHQVEPTPELRDWDFGARGQQYPCWIVLKHPPSNTAIGFCDRGFGPWHPWGLLWTGGEGNPMSMGQDFCWYRSFLLAYFESQAVCDLPIWRVFLTDPSGIKQPLSDENTWDETWTLVETYRKRDPESLFDCDTDLAVALRGEAD
jgi:hypothetical protein